jgi:hypothetical protein
MRPRLNALEGRYKRRGGKPRRGDISLDIRVWNGIFAAGDQRAKRDVKIVPCFRRAKPFHLVRRDLANIVR